MGNKQSSAHGKEEPKSFPGSALLDNAGMLCGSLTDTDDTGDSVQNPLTDGLCASSPEKDHRNEAARAAAHKKELLETKANPTSALFARALVSEVTDNPKTMTPAAMAEREKKLLKAQQRASAANNANNNNNNTNNSSNNSNGSHRSNTKNGTEAKPVGVPGGIGQPSVLGSIAHALGTDVSPMNDTNRRNNNNKRSVVEPPNSLQENRAQVDPHSQTRAASKYSVTIGLSLSRRHSTVGHPDTVTRQTAFDFNELQDRDYKYVSSTDSSGWRAGGGEKGGPHPTTPTGFDEDTDFYDHHRSNGQTTPMMVTPTQHHKVAAPDTVHIPIIQIDAETPEAVDTIVSALARGEVFIPHMSVLPEALSVNGISPPDLVVRFGCERNEDLPPDEWPNWCLEFMHNQLYEYFHSLGARWTKRPFQITLARKVRWKTVKHMNRYFAHAERVLDAWREKGPQYLDPQLTYIEGGATPEEVARPHGLYLMRNGVPTNYFAPNFDPPYTTKMTRSLLLNVLDKSWNKKHREWTSDPMPRIVTPTSLVATMCGCADPAQGGFMAAEVTRTQQLQSTTVDQAITVDDDDDDDKDATRTRSKQEMALDTQGGGENEEEEEEAPMATPPSHAREFDPIMQDRDQHEMPLSNNNNNKVELNPIDTATARDNTEKYLSPESSAASSSVVATRSPSPRFGRAPIPEGLRSAKSPRATTDVGVASEVAESTSTVAIANSTSAKLIQREMERKKQVMMKQVSEEGDTPAIMDELSPNSTATATSGETNKSSSRKKRRNKSKQEKKADMAREIAKVALSQSDQSSGRPAIVEASMQDPRKMELAQAVAHYEEKKLDGRYNLSEPAEIPAVAPATTTTTTTTTTIKSPEVQRTDSNVSLEYSMDSSMLGDTSTLAGQVFTNDNGSVSGATTKRRSGKNQLPTRPIASSSSYNTVDDDLKSSMSLQSAGTEVPSDEDLFSVGWAKALDPKSGSYYYFTLDRTKIVWENPLATETTTNTTTTTTTTSPNAAAAI